MWEVGCRSGLPSEVEVWGPEMWFCSQNLSLNLCIQDLFPLSTHLMFLFSYLDFDPNCILDIMKWEENVETGRGMREEKGKRKDGNLH